LSPCARSLSLKQLRAKSREHETYGCGIIPFWETGPLASQVFYPRRDSSAGTLDGTEAGGQIVKDLVFLVDNVSHSRLSGWKHAVNGNLCERGPAAE